MEEAFLALVRLGIGNESVHDSWLTVQGREAVDWETIENLAEKQGMLGIIYDAVQRLKTNTVPHAALDAASQEIPGQARNEVLPSQITWLRWMGKVMQGYEQRYVLYRKAVADLGAWYHAHGYRMMLLKGLACGLDWPRPEHRPYGDIDIWLFGRQQSADKEMFEEFKRFEGFKIDNSHHHHTIFQWQGFTVENHYDFVNVHVHRSSRELERLFKEIAGQARNEEVPANLHALFLVRHMVSHFSGASMSLRQVLDWGFFVKAHHEEVDWRWLVEVLEKYHMKEFFDCVNAICVEDLGFQWVIPHAALDAASHEIPGQARNEGSLKQRVLNDTLSPEFSEETPKHAWKRVPFKYRRWKSNSWKRELCYEDGQFRTFMGGVWNHLLKPAGI